MRGDRPWTGVLIGLSGASLTALGMALAFTTSALHGLARGVMTVTGLSAGGGWALTIALFVVLMFGVIILLSAVVHVLVTREWRQQIESLTDASALFAAGRLNHRITRHVEGDLALVATQMNAMAARLQEQARILQGTAAIDREALMRAEMAAAQSERERIGRDLHDQVSQDLFGLSMLCSAAVAKSGRNPVEGTALLADINMLAKRIQGSMRGILLELRPVQLRERTLYQALQQLTEELSQRATVAVTCQVQRAQEQGADIDYGVQEALFLIAQQALINAMRHSGASQISVRLNIEQDRVVLAVRDNGVGIDRDKMTMTSVGLQSMQERAQRMGGTFDIHSMSEGGAEILVIVPFVWEEIAND